MEGWHKRVDGRTRGRSTDYVVVRVDSTGDIWLDAGYVIAGEDCYTARPVCFTVDMARNLRAAIDEAIERASDV